MKIPVQSIDNIGALLAEVGTDYFDLFLYHYPFSMFDSKAQLKQSWIHMTIVKQSRFVKRIGVSNFYASHLTKLFDVCQEFNLEKPFANEVQINPYVYCLDLCFQYNIQLIAYSPLGFNAATIVLQDTGMQTIAEEIGITTANSRRDRYHYSAIIACMVTFKENLRHSQKLWTRFQKVKIPQPSYSIMLKNPRKTPTDYAC